MQHTWNQALVCGLCDISSNFSVERFRTAESALSGTSGAVAVVYCVWTWRLLLQGQVDYSICEICQRRRSVLHIRTAWIFFYEAQNLYKSFDQLINTTSRCAFAFRTKQNLLSTSWNETLWVSRALWTGSRFGLKAIWLAMELSSYNMQLAHDSYGEKKCCRLHVQGNKTTDVANLWTDYISSLVGAGTLVLRRPYLPETGKIIILVYPFQNWTK